MPEFQAWMKSDLRDDSRERLLWISGPLGIGKSIMSAYFIDILTTLYPNSIVLPKWSEVVDYLQRKTSYVQSPTSVSRGTTMRALF